MLPEYSVIVGALLNLAGTSSYIRDTIKGKARPNRVSWFMWSIAPFLAFSAEISGGVGIRSLTTFMAGFMPFLIFIASFANKRSYWKIQKLDIYCAILSGLGLVLWLITKEGFFAISCAILADGLAAVPTIVKSYKEPESENYFAFAAGGASGLIGLLTIKNWYYANYGFPLYIVLICTLFVTLIKGKVGPRIADYRHRK